jgi:putative ABC transport system substrate-binding protein
MQRREFISLTGGAAATWPLGALAQQRDGPRRVGVLMGFTETDEVWQTYLQVFRERLRDFGWTDGQNVKFEYRFAGESAERTQLGAAEFWLAADQMCSSSRPTRHCRHSFGKPT